MEWWLETPTVLRIGNLQEIHFFRISFYKQECQVIIKSQDMSLYHHVLLDK